MSSIADRIRLKLEALEKYNFDELGDEDSDYSDSGEVPGGEIELLNLEELEIDLSLAHKEFDLKFQKYLNEKGCLITDKQSLLDVEVLKLEDYQYKRLNEICSQEQKDGNALKYLLSMEDGAYLNQSSENKFNTQSNQFKSYSNSSSNYSTDFTKNFESNKKTKSYNYCELEGSSKENLYNYEEEVYFEESEDIRSNKDSIGQSESNSNKKAFDSTCFASSKRISESKSSECPLSLKEMLNYGTNANSNFSSNKSEGNNISKNSNEEKNSNSNKNSESEFYFWNKLSNESNSDALKTTSQSKNSDVSEPGNFFAFFSFIEEMLFAFMIIVLLFLDPFIILILKIIDCAIIKINKVRGLKKYSIIDKNINNDINYNNNNNCNYKNNFCSHLLICGEIEEMDSSNNFDNCEKENNNSLCERYYDHFFNSSVYKKLRKMVKICFVSISLFLNVIIILSINEKYSKVLLFFLNNLYLLYHTMDIYNETLLGYSESVRWSKILEKI